MAATKFKLSPGAILPRDMTSRQFDTWASEQSTQHIRSGAVGYDDGEGIWFGQDDDGIVKMFIGDSAGNKITWDGSTLTVVGNITLQANSVGETELQDGAVSEGKLQADSVTADKIAADSVTADKIAADSVTADKIDVTDLAAINADMGSITAGNIVLDEFIRSGQSAYDTGTGFWLGKDSGTPKFSIGNSAGASLTWDGSILTITDAEGADKTIEHLFFKGDSDTHPSIGQLIGSAIATTNQSIAGDDWQALRTIQTNFTGSFRLRVEARQIETFGAPAVDASWRLKNGIGSVVHTEAFTFTSYADTFSGEESITTAGEIWTIEGLSTTDLSTYTSDTEIRDIEVRARLNHATVS